MIRIINAGFEELIPIVEVLVCQQHQPSASQPRTAAVWCPQLAAEREPSLDVPTSNE